MEERDIFLNDIMVIPDDSDARLLESDIDISYIVLDGYVGDLTDMQHALIWRMAAKHDSM